MWKVGITGGIGSGKSLVCNVFQALNIPVYNADANAKMLQNTHPDIINQTKQLLGVQAYLPHGELNRSFVATAVFTNKSLLQKLNAIIHPVVYAHFNEWCLRHERNFTQYIVYESALTVETGYYKQLNKLILVAAPEAMRIQRVLNRDSTRSIAQIEAIIHSQMADAEKATVADYVLVNDDSQLLLPHILDIHYKILQTLP